MNRKTAEDMKTVTDKIRADCLLRADAVTMNNGERWCAGTEYPSNNTMKMQKRCEMCTRWIGNRFYKNVLP